MSVSSVRGKEFYETVNTGYGQSRKAREQEERFSRNVKEEERTEEQNPAPVSEEFSSGKIAAELFMQRMGRKNAVAVTECNVRRISYEESDFVKIYAADGFTLKAKVDLDACRVYVERKNEDGTYQAYEVDPRNVTEDAKSPITQTAMEAWARLREDGDDPEEDTPEEEERNLTLFEKRLQEFQEYVKERVKEGPPKIQIGGAAFSEEEWEKLIRKIDLDIDAYKEELRERIRKQKEASALKKAAKGVTDTTEEAAEAAEGAAESAAAAGNGTVQPSAGIDDKKAGQGLEISENEALEGIENDAPRGNSLLSRLLGTKKAPYSYLADKDGNIVYKGVTFVCDYQKNRLCLGDMSNPKNVITIPLAKGGCLCVNRDNIGMLAKAIGMFSAEDIGRIMRAIAQDNKVKEVEWELEAKRSEGGVEV